MTHDNKSETTNMLFKFVESSKATSAENFSARLIALSEERASAVMQSMQADEEVAQLGSKAFEASDSLALIDLIAAVHNEMQISRDADATLQGAESDALNRLLKSRQSDRCKTFAKGGVALHERAACQNYIAAMYAEMMIRIKAARPYKPSNQANIDETDLEAVSRRIKSLQSKKCTIGKLLNAGDSSQQDAYNDVVAEIDRLNSLRPNSRSNATTKVITKDALMAGLLAMSEEAISAMPADRAEIIRQLRSSFTA